MFDQKNFDESSVFTPENLSTKRGDKNIPEGNIPEVCVLDPDGDIVKYLLKTNQAELDKYWSCYHTNLYKFQYNEQTIGIIGNAVSFVCRTISRTIICFRLQIINKHYFGWYNQSTKKQFTVYTYRICIA